MDFCCVLNHVEHFCIDILSILTALTMVCALCGQCNMGMSATESGKCRISQCLGSVHPVIKLY